MSPGVGCGGGKAAAASAAAGDETGGGQQPKKQARGGEAKAAAVKTKAAAAGKPAAAGAGGAAYMSPIAHPLLEGKLLRRSLKLIHLAADRERALRSSGGGSSGKAAEPKQQQQQSGEGRGKAGAASWKLLRRGVHEVTKCLRRGMQGLVFFASDVFPIEIIAHLPILCEEKDVLYAYLCSKRTLGHAFRSQRPASVVMLTPPPAVAAAAGSSSSKKKRKAAPQKLTETDAAAAASQTTAREQDEEADEEEDESFEFLYAKVEKALRKVHPYF